MNCEQAEIYQIPNIFFSLLTSLLNDIEFFVVCMKNNIFLSLQNCKNYATNRASLIDFANVHVQIANEFCKLRHFELSIREKNMNLYLLAIILLLLQPMFAKQISLRDFTIENLDFTCCRTANLFNCLVN